MKALDQLRNLRYELSLAVNRRWWRWLTIWFGKGPGVTISFRLDRFLFLLIGSPYGIIRPLFFPVFSFLRVLSADHEIDYNADIGKGLRVLHPTLGVVVSGYTIAGENLTLTGGNCVGIRAGTQRGGIAIGSNVSLGANAVILGPVRIGDGCAIGAGAVVLYDATPGSILVGVPARPVEKKMSPVYATVGPTG
jgi:serine O-acetyltransferase